MSAEREKNMFDTKEIGRKISEFRKIRNMTQMELADRLNISFQAVSNWERGNSMPDISKLPELAELFGISIDELLGKKSELIANIIEGEGEEFPGNMLVAVDELREAAPILQPVQIEKIVEDAKQEFELGDMIDLLPFINQDIINKLAYRAAEKGRYDDIEDAAPFLEQKVIVDTAKKMIGDGKNIENIAPFIVKNNMGELAGMIYEKSGLAGMEDILPFIPGEVLQEIAEKEYVRGGHDFDVIAPFLDQKYLNEIAIRLLRDKRIEDLENMIAFVDTNVLGEFIQESLG